MRKISESIRVAALGPTPRGPSSMAAWVGLSDNWDFAYDCLDHGLADFEWRADNTARRTFLLLVAAALESA